MGLSGSAGSVMLVFENQAQQHGCQNKKPRNLLVHAGCAGNNLASILTLVISPPCTKSPYSDIQTWSVYKLTVAYVLEVPQCSY